MRYRVTRGFLLRKKAYALGDVVEIPEEDVAHLLADRLIEAVPEPEPEKPAPSDEDVSAKPRKWRK